MRRSPVPFVIAIVSAAFGLFSLELLAARLLLPVFGGSPTVWTTTLCFFTAVLFLGYLYAHLAATRLSFRTSAVVQASLVALAIAFSIAAPSEVASLRRPEMAPVLNVLLALAVLVGPAALVMASTTPLVSVWQAREREAPWWLYAASNAASLLALLAYPFLIAPNLPLSRQRTLVPVLLGVYGLALAWIVARRRTDQEASSPATSAGPELSSRRQAIWLLGAAAPAGLLAATTNFIETDLVAAPLIWIGPLAVYLASFVVAFSKRGRLVLPIAERLTPAAAALLWVPFIEPHWPVLPLLTTALSGLLILCLAVHGRLAADRPTEAGLTRFYLLISLGGMLATGFVAIVAPVIFSRTYEYPILIAATVMALALLPMADNPRRALLELVWRAAPFFLAAIFLHSRLSTGDPEVDRHVTSALLLGAAVVGLSATAAVNAVLTPIVLTVLIAFTSTEPLVRVRTFFGTTEVVAAGNTHLEFSGTTVHGLQFTDERSTEPTKYYAKVGPLGAIFEDLRGRRMNPSIGVVGLGVGTIAAYAQPGDRLTFFEIDRAVVDIASNPTYFTYLRDAPAAPHIVVGEGRLSLTAQQAASFDLLVLDAFTSDVVPAHLLTREAMQVYVRTLRPGGLLAFHLSSRFYNLSNAVGSTARSLGLASEQSKVSPTWMEVERIGAATSTWVVVGAVADVARFVALGWRSAPAGLVLTDDYSDLTRLLRVLEPEEAPRALLTSDEVAEAEALLDRSLEHAQVGRFEECIGAASQAATLNPDSSGAFNNMGFCEASLRHWDAAIRDLMEATRLDPNNQLARNNLAWVLAEKLEANPE